MSEQPYVRKHAVPCPHPDCKAVLALAPDAKAGIYVCPCQGVLVELEWRAPATYAAPQPYLSLAETETTS